MNPLIGGAFSGKAVMGRLAAGFAATCPRCQSVVNSLRLIVGARDGGCVDPPKTCSAGTAKIARSVAGSKILGMQSLHCRRAQRMAGAAYCTVCPVIV